MNSTASFNAFMQNGIGLTQNKQKTAITNHGFDTCQGLVDTTNDGIKEVFAAITRANRDLTNARDKVYIKEQIKQRFYGAKEEFLMRTHCGADITALYLASLDTDMIDGFVRKHQEWKTFKNSASSMSLPNVTVPKLTKSNWKLFSQAVKELLTRQRGVNEIPLVYVIRDLNGNYDDNFNSTEEQLIKCILLSGGKYRSDNGTVWSLLSENSVGTEAESIVNRFQRTRNGRAAWMALIAHMESTSYMDNIKSGAMSKLATTTYNGEKKNFGIVKYYRIHSEAHNDLQLAGEPLSDGMKITHFLQGLDEDTALNFAITSKAEPNVVTFEDFYNSFSAKLSTKLTLTQARSNTGSHRRINQVNAQSQGRGNGRGRGTYRGGNGNRDGGRFNSSGGRSFRGGNGRGVRGGRARNGQYNGYRHNPSQPNRWQPRAGTYAPDEWANLTEEQRLRVRDLRNAMQSSSSQSNQYTQRYVNQVTFDDSTSLPSQIQLPPRPSTSPTPAPSVRGQNSVTAAGGRAGDAFSTNHGRQSERRE